MHTPAPTVSIVVPIYKVERYLEQCIESILAQTYQNIEVILVDDGSPDACPAMCDAYAARDSRVQVIHQENQGAGPARNTGLVAARGEYVIFLDSDDIYLPQMLARMMARAEKHHADVVICRADALEEGGSLRSMPNQLCMEYLRRCGSDVFSPRQELPQHLFQFVCGWPWDKLYRRDFLLLRGLQFQTLEHTEDAYFVYISLVHASRVSVDPTVLVHHRLHRASLSHNIHVNSGCLTDALLAVYNELQRFDTHNTELFISFYNWAMNIAMWHYKQLQGSPAEAFQHDLRYRLEPALHLLEKGMKCYYRRKDWLNYKACVMEGFKFKQWKILGIPLLLREELHGKTSYSLCVGKTIIPLIK